MGGCATAGDGGWVCGVALSAVLQAANGGLSLACEAQLLVVVEVKVTRPVAMHFAYCSFAAHYKARTPTHYGGHTPPPI